MGQTGNRDDAGRPSGCGHPSVEGCFRAIIERSLDAVILFDGDAVIRYASPSSARLMGHRPEDLAGVNGFELLHPDDQGRVRDLFARLRAEPGGTSIATYRVRHREGGWRWLEARGINLLDEPAVRAVVATYHDVTGRRAAEEARSRLAAIVESSQDAILSADLRCTILSWNPAAERLFGYAAEEVVGTPVQLLAPPDEHAHTWEVVGRLARGEPVPTYEAVRLKKGGIPVHVSVTLSPVRDPEGLIVAFSVVYRDVTGEREAWEALRRSEARFRALIEKSYDGIDLLAADGTVLYASPSVTRIGGRTPEEVIGRNAFEWCHPEDAARLSEEFARFLEFPGCTLTARHRYLAKDGSWRWTESTSTNLLGDTSIGAIVCNFHDVTEQKQAEDEVREWKSRYEAAVRATGQVLYHWDTATNAIDWGGTYELILGYSSGEIPKSLEGWMEIIHPDDRGAFHEEDERVRVTGKPFALEYRVRRKDGVYLRVQDNGYFFQDAEGKAARMVGFVRDVTEQRQLEEQLRQAQKMEAVGRLAGGIAHDFNNLLTVINGYSEVALGFLPQGDQVRLMLTEIKAAGDRAAGLVSQLLAFGRKQMLQQRVLDLNVLVRDLEKMLGRVIGEDVRVLTELHPAPLLIRGDPSQAEQVVLNLAVNARDAMPAGGSLTLSTARVVLGRGRDDDHTEIHPGPYALLAVTDTGCGMDEATRGHIFEPFFTTKEVGKGTGLGLATVYGIVKQSGGHVKVHTEVGRGTRFEIYLPAAEEPEKASAPPAGGGPLPGGAETILAVEDEDGVRALTEHLLTRLGYRVLVAANASEAVRVAERHEGRIDLLMTDVVMPGMAGGQLAEVLRGKLPGVKVLYLSGYTDDEVVRHGVSDSEVAFLAKPFTIGALSKKVRQVLDS